VFTPRFQAVYIVGTLLAFSVVALLTRAGRRPIAAAVCSVAVFTALSTPIDAFGRVMGLWTYPSGEPTLVVYVGQSLEYVGCLTLVGWRVHRRFGRRGIVVAACLTCVLGAARDFVFAAVRPDVLHVGPLPWSLLGDVAAWAVVALVALSGSVLSRRAEPRASR